MPGKTIIVLGTMDTKGREMTFVKDEIERHGQKALLIDTGWSASRMAPPT